MSNRSISGPFGNYQHGSAGATLNACYHTERVPLRLVENFEIGKASIQHQGQEVAMYQWFKDIDVPLFHWTHPDFRTYSSHDFVTVSKSTESNDKTILKPKFRLTLSVHGSPAFEISGRYATSQLHQFLCGMLTNVMTDPRYKISKNAGAFFQGGYNDPEGKWFLIEFWNQKGAQAFIDYMNENYQTRL